MGRGDGFVTAVVLTVGVSLILRRSELPQSRIEARGFALRAIGSDGQPNMAHIRSIAGSGPTEPTRWFGRNRVAMLIAAIAALAFGPLWGLILEAGWIVLSLVRGAQLRASERKVLRLGLMDLVDDVARRLRGGLSINTALHDAVTASHIAFVQVFTPVISLLEIGTTPSIAIASLAAHSDNRDLYSLATMLGAGEQLGGIRPDALDGLAAMMRERSAAGADVQTQAAQARMSAIVLGLAPIAFCGLLVLGDGRSSAFLLQSPRQ